MTEHDSLIGSAYNDGYDEGYRDGAEAVLKQVEAHYVTAAMAQEIRKGI